MYNHIRIIDMAIGEVIDGFYILSDAKVRKSRNDSPYLCAKLTDASGSIDARFWDYASYIMEDGTGEVVHIRGAVGSYNERKQLMLSEIRFITQEESCHLSLSDLVPHAPMPAGQLFGRLEAFVESIEDKECRSICNYFLGCYSPAILKTPAAKSIHHGFVHGWLMHTVSMLNAADSITSQYPNIDRDLLMTGVFLHDIGKFREFELSQYGLVTDYSREGQLIGHPVLGVLLLLEAAEVQSVAGERITLLAHMILSHHGSVEHGAVVTPAFAEAELLAHLDMMDARIEQYAEVTANMDPNTFSPYVYGLDKRIFHKVPVTEMED